MRDPTNGPPAAQQYRERNPQTKPQKPRQPLSLRVRLELTMGRLQSKLNIVQDETGPYQGMPLKDKARLEKWLMDFLETWHGKL